MTTPPPLSFTCTPHFQLPTRQARERCHRSGDGASHVRPRCSTRPEHVTPTETNTEDKKMEPHFFRLSPELRNEIYRLVIPTGCSFYIDDRYASPDTGAEPAVLRTNRQIRNEAITIYYQENEWNFPMRNFDAGCYIEWSWKSPFRLGANIRWSHKLSFAITIFTVHASGCAVRAIWPSLMHWLEA